MQIDVLQQKRRVDGAKRRWSQSQRVAKVNFAEANALFLKSLTACAGSSNSIAKWQAS
jgi:hypothetical protein